MPSARWGQRMGDGGMLDAMVGALTDPFDGCHMGITAENVAEKWGISREAQDALALESHKRALDLGEGLVKVGDNVVDMLDADGQADHLFGDACLGHFVRSELAMGSRGRVTG